MCLLHLEAKIKFKIAKSGSINNSGIIGNCNNFAVTCCVRASTLFFSLTSFVRRLIPLTALIRLDLPTPDEPQSTEVFPFNISLNSSNPKPSRADVNRISNPKGSYIEKTFSIVLSLSDKSFLLKQRTVFRL